MYPATSATGTGSVFPPIAHIRISPASYSQSPSDAFSFTGSVTAYKPGSVTPPSDSFSFSDSLAIDTPQISRTMTDSFSTTDSMIGGKMPQLPVGLGWHPLNSSSNCGSSACPNIQLSTVGPANNANGLCNDIYTSQSVGQVTCNTTVSYNVRDSAIAQIYAQSGGVATDDSNPRMWIWGGGHQDYCGNQVVEIDFLGGPPSLKLATQPSVCCSELGGSNKSFASYAPYVLMDPAAHTDYPAGNTFGNMTPPSEHSYGGLVWVPSRQTWLIMGGVPWYGGGMNSEVYEFSPTLDQWAIRATAGGAYSQAPLSQIGTAAQWDPSSQKVIVLEEATNKRLDAYDPQANTFVPLSVGPGIANLIALASGGNTVTQPTLDICPPITATTPCCGTLAQPETLAVVQASNSYPPLMSFLIGPPTAVGFAEVDTVTSGSITAGTTNLYTDSSCVTDPICAGEGMSWAGDLGVMVLYPGYGKNLAFYNPTLSSVTTPYVTIGTGSTPGVTYPNNPIRHGL